MKGTTENPGHTVRAGMDLPLESGAAFDALVSELQTAFGRTGIGFEPGPDGRIRERETEVGRILTWEPGKRVLFRWQQAPWEPGEITELELTCEKAGEGTRVTLEHRSWGRLLGDGKEVAGWFAGAAIAPLMSAMMPERLGDWITDRRARRPSGAQSLAVYRDPLYHYPGFRVLLEELALSRSDVLLEVGCGGGVLLRKALECGCRGAGVDHSPEMARLAREVNSEAVSAGRLEILDGGAEKLPFPDGKFTCATMSGVLGFIGDLPRALRELLRVLRPGGRIVLMGTEESMRGTPAAPEPIASRLHFYNDKELEGLARDAGFGDARVIRRSLEKFARESGIPEEHLTLFKGEGTPILIAHSPTH